ncbi:transporter substrate-binding domain-containing protein [Ideonella sp. DXS29W]|uniref:Transporter substrate-binding domain-containing protein n=1 Tax=Ideonella lacteola TaxID=2984193 RepID=A0ABU9BSD7_9BURK
MRRRSAWAVLAVAATALVPLLSASPPARAEGAAQPLRFLPERDYGPFVFIDEQGHLAGLSVDMLQLVLKQAGLHIQVLPAAPLKLQLQRLRRGEADLISSLRPTPERGAYLAFSVPYVSVPAIVVGRAAEAPGDTADGGTVLSALVGRTVAVGEGYGVEAFVRSRMPQVNWQAVPDDVQALRGVAEGRFDAAVVDTASAAFVKQRHQLKGLARWGTVGFEYTLSFAVPRERTDLLEKLNDGIRLVPRADAQAVIAKWMKPIEDDDFLRREQGAVMVGVAGVLLAVVGAGALSWAWQRRRQERRQVS